MIKNVEVELDGFTYNIVQMSGEQAFKMQLKLLQLGSHIQLDGLADKDVENIETIIALIRGVMCAANPDLILPIVKELLANCGLKSVNTQIANAAGFDPDRHVNKRVLLDNFYGKDMLHLYHLLYEILKANYEDFFVGAKKWLGSSFLGKTLINSPQ